MQASGPAGPGVNGVDPKPLRVGLSRDATLELEAEGLGHDQSEQAGEERQREAGGPAGARRGGTPR